MHIRNIIFCCGLLSLFFSAQAATIEKQATGTSAEALVQALKLTAGINSKKVADHYNYDADSLYCHSSYATEDGLQAYDCKINSKSKITDAPAKLLYDAMKNLNMWDDPGMSQTRIRAEHVHCLMHPSAQERFHCRWQEPKI